MDAMLGDVYHRMSSMVMELKTVVSSVIGGERKEQFSEVLEIYQLRWGFLNTPCNTMHLPT